MSGIGRAARCGVEALRRFAREWSRDNAALLSAGVAFYSIFSIAPLLALLAMAGALVSAGAPRQRSIAAIAQFVSPQAGRAFADLMTAVSRRSSGVTLVTVVVLIFGASAVFRHLRTALDIVLDVPDTERSGWLQWLIGRAVAILMVLAMILFLLVTLVASAALALAARYLPSLIRGHEFVWRAADLLLSTLLLAILAAVALRWVPVVRLPWPAIARGAAVAAALFSASRYAVSVYLAHAEIATVYGAAGSLLVALLAVYLAVLALFAGAEVAELSARRDVRFAREREAQQSEPGYVARKRA